MNSAPFMSAEESAMILRYLAPSHVMLEWGAGGSTLFFSRHVRDYYSVEHDPEWHASVRAQVESAGLDNVHLSLVPPDEPLAGVPNYARTPEQREAQFQTYIHYPEHLDVAFDRVLVDGRSRPECALAILPRLASDAIVFIHDYFNTRYDEAEYHSIIDGRYELIDGVRVGQTLAVFRPRKDVR